MAKKKSVKKKATKKKAGKKKAGKKTAGKKAAAMKGIDAMAAFASTTDAGCLDQADAARLVFACAGETSVAPGTRLGDLFPSPVQRQGFCGCVFTSARNAGVPNPNIPCDASTTIADVIGSISC